jgi:hypothetical protein
MALVAVPLGVQHLLRSRLLRERADALNAEL